MMQLGAGTLRALEFDRIVSVLSGLAATPTGRDTLAALAPSTDSARVLAWQRATTEGRRFLADHPGLPLRAPLDLGAMLERLALEGGALEALQLLALADYLDSIVQARSIITTIGESFPILRTTVQAVASFDREISDVRRMILASGDVADDATPRLAATRERLRRQRTLLRSTLDAFVRGRDTAKYLQDQIITERNGRFVLVVRAEHRTAIPGVVHGASGSGASLFLEPLETVDVNNEIVELEEQEIEEVHRILVALTDTFRGRADDLERTLDVATELDSIQARAQLSQLMDGIEPTIADDGTFELRGARHPLLMKSIAERLHAAEFPKPRAQSPKPDVVPVDILLPSPNRVLIIAGPNTGGKTVALKTAGLFAAMAQAGLHIPVDKGSRVPIFRSLFADIGDEQSIAANLSTFSAHITNVVSMDRDLELPALVLLDEVGAGTDPVEGAALGIAIIERFRQRGAHLIATTHYDALKSYASTTEGVSGAAFGFSPDTFAPTYRLVYRSPGRSLALEIAARLGVPPAVIASAREHLSEPEKQLAEHLARMDEDLRRLEEERHSLARERSMVAEGQAQLRMREQSITEREERIKRRLDAKLNEQLREARREIDAVIDGVKTRAATLSEQAAVRLNVGSPPGTPARLGASAGGRLRPAGLSTGDVGTLRADARTALDRIAERVRGESDEEFVAQPPERGGIQPGSRVTVGPLGLEGVVLDVHGSHANVDVRGKRLRAAVRDLRIVDAGLAARSDSASPREPASVRPGHRPAVHINVDLQPREGARAELNLIGSTVDEALDRLEKFLDQATLADLRELRIIHGYGTGQLRKAVARFLKGHALVERVETASDKQGGGGATIVYLKD